MNKKLRKYERESKVLQNKLINQQQFGYEKFISDDSKMIFYTGLSSEQFNALWELIEPEHRQCRRQGLETPAKI